MQATCRIAKTREHCGVELDRLRKQHAHVEFRGDREAIHNATFKQLLIDVRRRVESATTVFIELFRKESRRVHRRKKVHN